MQTTSTQGRYLLIVENIFNESINVKQEVRKVYPQVILEMAESVAKAFQDRRRLFLFCNGAGAADDHDIAAEFVNRFQIELPPLPAIALTVDATILTAVGNDFHFNDIFLKQTGDPGRLGDVALRISASGRSPNVLKALQGFVNIKSALWGSSATTGRKWTNVEPVAELKRPQECENGRFLINY